MLGTSEDVDAVINDLLAGSADQNMAEPHSLERSLLPSGFPDHELLVGVDSTHQVGALEFMDADGNVVSHGLPGGRDVASYFIVGNEVEFPDHSEVPVDLVRRAVKEFLLSGGQRPTCVQWRRPEFW
ncbi:hypothetical protein E1293_04950 [Actinomadura darangshiensis]|uniref:Immunity protein Imm1 n=1 Tax=Actinomadura darangshiensis TaxID=705336 RepID=A0A4R5BQQ8_9ACTN|nr:Imm1 family immunity protein [Actinomadura darangshiensis]TDD89288.1 hypothetical protein E1293_04950 [Actinomadura darangshiensis]